MSDIPTKKSRGKKYIGGASPIVPSYVVGDAPPPNNPPGSGGIGDFVTLDTDQTITGEKTFDNSLLIHSGPNPILRIKATSNQSTLNFRNFTNEDQAGIILDAPSSKLSIVTRTDNSDIEIEPHGTGSIILPNVAIGTPVSNLGLDVDNKVVTSSASSVTNPETFVWDFSVAGNGSPDVTGGGIYRLHYPSASGFFGSLEVGDTAKMVVEGQVFTRNAPNLLSSIGSSIIIGRSFSLPSDWNFFNSNFGQFRIEHSVTREDTSRYRDLTTIYIRATVSGSTQYDYFLSGSINNYLGSTTGSARASVKFVFAEASVENKLIFTHGVIQLFRKTQ